MSSQMQQTTDIDIYEIFFSKDLAAPTSHLYTGTSTYRIHDALDGPWTMEYGTNRFLSSTKKYVACGINVKSTCQHFLQTPFNEESQ
jgi:hypothetical protein